MDGQLALGRVSGYVSAMRLNSSTDAGSVEEGVTRVSIDRQAVENSDGGEIRTRFPTPVPRRLRNSEGLLACMPQDIVMRLDRNLPFR